MKKNNENIIKYFSCVTNSNIDMLAAIFGRRNLLHEKATLQGYELCIQTINEIRDVVPKNSPLKISPREIIKRGFGPSFNLYVLRANPESNLRGTIWYVSPQEYEFLRDWELIDMGMQDDIIDAIAITDKGESIYVRTHGLVKNPKKVAKVVDINYGTFIAPKKSMLKNARRARREFIERMKNK